MPSKMQGRKAKLTLFSPVRHLQGVGPKIEQRFAKLHIQTIQDLLLHLPTKYQDRTKLTQLKDITDEGEVLVAGEITNIRANNSGRKGQTIISLSDGTGELQIVLFTSFRNASHHTVGSNLLCFGIPRYYNFQLQMIHPELETFEADQMKLPETLTPIYPSTAGLHQKTIRKLIRSVLEECENGLLNLELLSETCMKQFELSPLYSLLGRIHFPKPSDELEALKQQLGLEELATHHLNILRIKRERARLQGPVINIANTDFKKFEQSLDFELTKDQIQTMREIEQDMAGTIPMLRLVQGDVGSGKTVIAAFAALSVLRSGYQVAFMAPTEILANQHFETLKPLMEKYPEVSLSLLTGKTNRQEKQQIKEALKNRSVMIVVGTHALYQQDVEFESLGLVIIDEQHRFGVEQRRSLGKESSSYLAPHQLVLTATPIPRTLAMSIFSSIETSTIRTLPSGRLPTTTVVLPSDKRLTLIERIRSAITENKQVFWVCPLIQPDESSEGSSPRVSIEEVENLIKTHLPETTYSTVHGKMSGEGKQRSIESFIQKESMILIATTVIEVGVNIPNASIMVIEDADRFGLAQLHQLRGRVGRGNQPGYCILLYQNPLTEMGKNRLMVIRTCSDGFDIAEQDLSLRGPGEVLGTDQTGSIQFKVADIARDAPLLPRVKSLAEWILDFDHNNTPFKLNQRWLKQSSEETSLA